MTTEFEDRDLTGAEFWGVLLRDATFRDVDFSGVRTHHVLLDDVEIDGFVDGLVVNGVDVTEFVNANDPWQPLRGLLRPAGADGVRTGWAEMQRAWNTTITHGATLGDAVRNERVGDEWSFAETLRHLVFVTDKWIAAPFHHATFHAIGIPNRGSADRPWPGLDHTAEPTFDEIVATRRAQAAAIDAAALALVDADLGRTVEVPENGTVTVLDCWHTLLEEEFEHHRYALRDLAHLGSQPRPTSGNRSAAASPRVTEPAEMRLEVIGVPVTDVDSAIGFYRDAVGFSLDHDVAPADGVRVVQLTPPGSQCSIVFGDGLPFGEPGAVRGLQLVVADLDTVHAELAGRGVEVSEIQLLGPEGEPGSRFVFFDDLDGNGWAIQEMD